MKEVVNRSRPETKKAGLAREDSWARISIRKAEAFNVEFNVKQTLGFKTPLQDEIFNFYFAYYILRKDGNNANYLLNHPSSGTLKKIPLLKKLPAFLERVYNEQEESAKLLFAEANEMSVTFENIVKNSVNEELSRKLGLSIVEIEDQMEKEGAEGLKEIINAFGSPNAIQRAANLLSSIYIDKKKLSEPDFNLKVKNILLQIKTRDFSPKE